MDGQTTRLGPGFYDYHGAFSAAQSLENRFVLGSIERMMHKTPSPHFPPLALRVTAEPNGYDDAIILRWNDRTREKTRVQVEGYCMSDEEWELSAWNDSGELRLAMSQLPIRSNWNGGSCTIEVTVERCRQGRIDPGFYGGSIEACQVRTETRSFTAQSDLHSTKSS